MKDISLRAKILRCLIENEQVYEAELAEAIYGDRSKTANLAQALDALKTGSKKGSGEPYIERYKDLQGSTSARNTAKLVRKLTVIQTIYGDIEYKDLQDAIFQQRWVHELLLNAIPDIPEGVKTYIKERSEESQFLFSLLLGEGTRQATITEMMKAYDQFSASQHDPDKLAGVQARHTLVKSILESIYHWDLLNGVSVGESADENLKDFTALLIELDDFYDSICVEQDDLSMHVYLDRSDTLKTVISYSHSGGISECDIKDRLKYESGFRERLDELHTHYGNLYSTSYTPRHRAPPVKTRVITEFK